MLVDHHGFGALGHWEPYALVVLGALGFVVNQRAFQAGSLTASLPTLTVVEPIVAALIGITMLHETVPTDGALEWIAVARVGGGDGRADGRRCRGRRHATTWSTSTSWPT